MAVSTKVAVFWIVAPCSLVDVYERFRGPCCLHHQGDYSSTRLYGATTQKTAIFIIISSVHISHYITTAVDSAAKYNGRMKRLCVGWVFCNCSCVSVDPQHRVEQNA
jgi:hypothetical protein